MPLTRMKSVLSLAAIVTATVAASYETSQAQTPEKGKKSATAEPSPAAKASDDTSRDKSAEASSDATILRLVDAAHDGFRPIDAKTLEVGKEHLAAAVAKLDAYLAANKKEATGWQEFLMLPLLRTQAKKGSIPNIDALLVVRSRFSSGHAGLELQPMADVRVALNDVIGQMLGQTVTAEAYKEDLAKISQGIKSPKHDTLAAMAEAADRLDRAGRAPQLLDALRQRFSHPNVTVNLSNRLVWTGMTREIDETAPLRDNILGTAITGTGRTIGWAQAKLIPDPDRGLIQTLITGRNYARTVGHNGPAVIYSTGDSELRGEKTIVITPDGLSSLPAEATVATRSRVTGIASTKRGVVDKIVKRVAADRVPQEKARGERVAQEHSQRMFRRKLDEQADTQIADANDRYQHKIRGPLLRLGAFPQKLAFSTTADYLDVVGLQSGPAQLGATSIEPVPDTGADLLIRVHESMFSNTATNMLAGRTLDQPQIDRISMDLFGKLPDRNDGDPETQEPWSVTFAEDRPMTLSLDDSQATVVIRGTRFTSATRKFEGMRITVRYTLAREGGTLRAARQGDVEVVPIDFVPGRQTLSARQAALLGPIRKRFGRLFQSQFVSDGLQLRGNLERMGVMPASHLKVDDGWAVVGWVKAATAEAE